MERAGTAAADLVLSPPRVLLARLPFYAGPVITGRRLRLQHEPLLKEATMSCVQVAGKSPKEGTNAYKAKQMWEEIGGRTFEDPYNAPKSQVVVDAIFGIGLNKPLKGGIYRCCTVVQRKEKQCTYHWISQQDSIAKQVSGLVPCPDVAAMSPSHS